MACNVQDGNNNVQGYVKGLIIDGNKDLQSLLGKLTMGAFTMWTKETPMPGEMRDITTPGETMEILIPVKTMEIMLLGETGETQMRGSCRERLLFPLYGE